MFLILDGPLVRVWGCYFWTLCVMFPVFGFGDLVASVFWLADFNV